MHGQGQAAVLGRVALPAHPGRSERLRADRAADHGGAEPVPGGDRPAPGGHHLSLPGRRQPGPGPRLPAARHHRAAEEGPPALPGRLLHRGPGRAGRAGGAVQPGADRQDRHQRGLGQRGRRRHRHRGRHRRPTRRRPGDQPQLQDPGRRAERAELGGQEGPGGRERRQPGRGRGDDHHRPGRGHGQLPRLQPQRLDQRHLAVTSSTRCSARRTGPRPSTGRPRASTPPVPPGR